jgi:hypothetical protein
MAETTIADVDADMDATQDDHRVELTDNTAGPDDPPQDGVPQDPMTEDEFQTEIDLDGSDDEEVPA